MPILNDMSRIVLNIWNDINSSFVVDFNALPIVIDCHIENPHRVEMLLIIRCLSALRTEMELIAKEKSEQEKPKKLKSNIG